MASIVTKFMVELAEQLATRGVTITADADARAWLAKKGYDPDQGARPLARVIQEDIKRRLGDELLFGKLEHGGRVELGVKDGALSFAFTEAVKAEAEPKAPPPAVPATGKRASPSRPPAKKPVLN